jgi:PBSX family phage portal protein
VVDSTKEILGTTAGKGRRMAAAPAGKGAGRSRIWKARSIGIGGGVMLDEKGMPVNPFPSQQLLEDPFAGQAGYGGTGNIRQPPYSLEQMVMLAEQEPVHAAALEQKTVDIIADGIHLEPRDDDTDAPAEQEADIMGWLDDLCEQMTVVELLNAVWLDFETVGWAFIEIARDVKGVVQRVYHIPAHTVRPHSDGKRYVQIRQGRQVWFKRWGVGLEEVPILASNGNPAPESTSFEKLANEVLVFVKPSRRSTWFGIPTYVAGMGYITLSLAARDYNIKFFSNAREPRYMIVVSGLDEDEVEGYLDDLEESLSTQHVDPHRNLILPATGNTQVKLERLTMVQNDMHFTKLLESTDKNILVAHRMPPDRLGTVMRGTLGGNVSQAVNKIYKSAVVRPGQTIAADRLDRFVSTEYARYKGMNDPAGVMWEVSLEDLDLSDEELEVDTTLNKVKTNLITLNEGRAELGWDENEAFAEMTLSEYLVNIGASGQVVQAALAATPDTSQSRTNAAILQQLEALDATVRDIMIDGPDADALQPVGKEGE